jgi:hypothetical protein
VPELSQHDVRASAAPRDEDIGATWFFRAIAAAPAGCNSLGLAAGTYRAGATVVVAIAIASIALLVSSILMAPDMRGGRRSSADDISNIA